MNFFRLLFLLWRIVDHLPGGGGPLIITVSAQPIQNACRTEPGMVTVVSGLHARVREINNLCVRVHSDIFQRVSGHLVKYKIEEFCSLAATTLVQSVRILKTMCLNVGAVRLRAARQREWMEGAVGMEFSGDHSGGIGSPSDSKQPTRTKADHPEDPAEDSVLRGADTHETPLKYLATGSEFLPLRQPPVDPKNTEHQHDPRRDEVLSLPASDALYLSLPLYSSELAQPDEEDEGFLRTGKILGRYDLLGIHEDDEIKQHALRSAVAHTIARVRELRTTTIELLADFLRTQCLIVIHD